MNDVVEVRMNLIPSCIYLLAIFAALCGALAKRRAVFSISMLLAMGTGASIVAGSVEPPPAPSTNGPSEWQDSYREMAAKSRRIEAEPAK